MEITAFTEKTVTLPTGHATHESEYTNTASTLHSPCALSALRDLRDLHGKKFLNRNLLSLQPNSAYQLHIVLQLRRNEISKLLGRGGLRFKALFAERGFDLAGVDRFHQCGIEFGYYILRRVTMAPDAPGRFSTTIC